MIWKKILESIFPPICLHCDEKMSTNTFFLCPSCQELLVLSSSQPKEFLDNCLSAYAFEAGGPSMTLYKKMYQGQQAKLAKGFASFLFMRLASLGWQDASTIIPLPSSYFQGYYIREIVKELKKYTCSSRKCSSKNDLPIICITDFLSKGNGKVAKRVKKLSSAYGDVYLLGIFD